MLKTFRFRRFLGVIAATIGVLALALAADPPPIPGACANEEVGVWETAWGGCQDQITGLVWSANYTDLHGGTLPWSMANDYCNNLMEGGFSDWRLPTPAEVQSAAQHDAMDTDFTLPPPYIGVNHHLATEYAVVWTSQIKGNKATRGDLRTGVLTINRPTTGLYVECVRKAPLP
jgi:hypothetical protein